MSNIELIKELRSLTQAAMKDCKESLEEANWDLQRAIDIVKTKGLNIVSGREGKIASEGLVAIVPFGSRGLTMVEVNCQTDFVANSTDFRTFGQTVAMAISDATLQGKPFTVDQVDASRNNLVSTTKENVVVRRWWVEEAIAEGTVITSYIHSNSKIGVLLTLKASTNDVLSNPEIVQLGEDLAMQVAAMNPIAVSVDQLDAEVIERQRGIFETQLAELNKPQAAWAKIIEGKFNKWYTEVCLLNQESVLVPKTTIEQIVKNLATKLGTEIKLVKFVRCQVGEGIVQEKTNLADEVAKMVG